MITYLFVLLITILLIEAYFLISQNNRLKRQLATLRNSGHHLLIDELAPSIEVVDLEGKSENINFSKINKKSLLFIFSLPCVPCEKNFAFWQRLYATLKQDAYIVAIAMAELNEAMFLKNTDVIKFQIYIPKDKNKFGSSYRVFALPQTLLIDNKGKIQWIKLGNLNGDDYNEIKKLVLGKTKGGK